MGMIDSMWSMVGYGGASAGKAPEEKVAAREGWAERQKARAERLWAPGEWEQVTKDLESVLGSELASTEIVNVGDPEIKGFNRMKGAEGVLEKPKKRCDDRKINDPERGLFAVMDGVSTGHGAIAAELTSRIIQARMGKSLDVMLKNLFASGAADEAKINEVVARTMQSAVYESHAAVLKAQKLKPDYQGASTTLSMAKLVDMPDGRLRLYYANIGDSRIYTEHGGRLYQMTEDDSQLNHFVRQGIETLSDDELDAVDQFVDENALTETQRRYVGMRHIISDGLGMTYDPEWGTGRKTADFRFDSQDPDRSDVRFIDLEPGQKIVITSDGVHDNSLRIGMQQALKKSDARGVERQLQQDALAIQQDVQKDYRRGGRGKPDDISAVVAEAVPRRDRVTHAGEAAPARMERKYNPSDVPGWRDRLHELDVLASRGQLNEEQRLERVNLEYWIAKAQADDLTERANDFRQNRRLRPGDRVDRLITRSSGAVEPLAFDVTGFKTEKNQHLVSLRGMTDRGTEIITDLDERIALNAFSKQLDKREAEAHRQVTMKAGEWRALRGKGTSDRADQIRRELARIWSTSEQFSGGIRLDQETQSRVARLRRELHELGSQKQP